MAKSRPPGPCNFFWMKVTDAGGARQDAELRFSEVAGGRQTPSLGLERSPLPVVSAVKDGTYVISLQASGYAASADADVMASNANVSCVFTEVFGPRPLALSWIDSDDGKAWRGNASHVFFIDAALVPLD